MREIREDIEVFLAEGRDAGVAKFDEVVGKDSAGEADSDPLDSLSEQERKLNGESNGLFVSTVVGGSPICDFGAEGDVESKLREAGFDVTRGGRIVACENVTPVALGVDEEFLLSQLDHGVANGGVAMRVILHGVADNIGDLVVATVFELVHGMENAALDGFEAVVDVGDGAFQDDVGGVVEEPVAIEIIDGTDFDWSCVFENRFL